MSAYVSLAPYYDELTRDVPYEKFAELYEEIFRKYGITPETVLDLACGTGTLTAIMARRGYEMIGADRSEDMLSEAMDKACELTDCVRPIFLGQAMTELDLYGTVSAAYCSLDGINYVPPAQLGEVFHRLRLFIEPGGVFVFDINTPEKLRSQNGEVYIDETENVYCVWRAEFNDTIKVCTYGMDIFIREGALWTRRQEEHTEYAHEPEFLLGLLQENGFGEFSSEKWPDGRLFIAARRLTD